IHVETAFARVHDWSNAAAFRHVEEVSGYGAGLYVSYVFTALWTADVVWWWIDPHGYESRSRWIDRGIHGFMAFMVFSATVVYETGFIRWAGVALFSLIGILFVNRFWRERVPRVSP